MKGDTCVLLGVKGLMTVPLVSDQRTAEGPLGPGPSPRPHLPFAHHRLHPLDPGLRVPHLQLPRGNREEGQAPVPRAGGRHPRPPAAPLCGGPVHDLPNQLGGAELR